VTVEDIGDVGPISKRLLATRDSGDVQTVLLQAAPVIADEESAIDEGPDTGLQTLGRYFRGTTPDNGNVIHNNQAHV
jgi:hypothetical protein